MPRFASRKKKGPQITMPTEQKARTIQHMFTGMAPYLDLFTRGFSLGLDQYWRKQGVRLSGIKKGDQVLDICAGTGELTFILARAVGNEGSVVATDYCENMLELARKKMGTKYSNITFQFADATKTPFSDNTFDAVTVAYGMRNIPDTTAALQEVRRVLKPGGTFLCVELTRPRNRFFLALYKWYSFRVMPFVSKLVMKTADPFIYLPRSIEEFYQPPIFRKLLEDHGFSNVTVDSMTMGIATVYCAKNPR
jgi:demethylmenaquinone methyltransferase/2-methoxy-6-polyprenyl-1,4-benzoquinol methylase